MLTHRVAFKELLVFALPIILGHVGIMLIGTGDMIIAGRYSRECLAAIGLAVSIANPVMISLLGLQFAISPILAQKRGAGESIDHYYWTVVFFSIVVATVSCALSLATVALLPYFNYEAGLTAIIRDYLIINAFSAFGLCLYQGAKEFFQAQEKTLAANTLALLAAGLNVFFNYAFVFGKFGVPELREPGLAWASLGVRMFMGIGLFLLTCRAWKSAQVIEWGMIKEATKLGLPITLTLFLEIMAFCSVTLFIGKFAEVQTAATNIVLNLASLAFMLPMSVGAAIAVKVGHAFGEKSYQNIRVFSQVALMTSIGFMCLSGSIFYFLPEPLLHLYTVDAEVVRWSKALLFWCACFQLFDGAQVTLAGILRGLSISKPSSAAIFIGYWVIGLPLGYFLGFHAGLESQGFWIGLAVALGLVTVMLGFILKHKFNRLLSHD